MKLNAIRVEAGLAHAEPWRGQIVGVYERAVSIRTESDRLVSLLAGIPGVPDSIHVPSRLISRCRRTMPVRGGAGSIVFGDSLVVVCRDCPVWNSGAASLDVPPGRFLTEAAAVLEEYGQESVSEDLTELEAIIRSHAPGTERAIRRMIGRGVGLTPEGDDFLVGLLAGCDLLPSTALFSLECIIRENIRQTTWISRCFLEFALDRRFGEPVGRMAAAIAGRDTRLLRRAAQETVSVGASSGHAVLRGFRAALAC